MNTITTANILTLTKAMTEGNHFSGLMLYKNLKSIEEDALSHHHLKQVIFTFPYEEFDAAHWTLLLGKADFRIYSDTAFIFTYGEHRLVVTAMVKVINQIVSHRKDTAEARLDTLFLNWDTLRYYLKCHPDMMKKGDFLFDDELHDLISQSPEYQKESGMENTNNESNDKDDDIPF